MYAIYALETSHVCNFRNKCTKINETKYNHSQESIYANKESMGKYYYKIKKDLLIEAWKQGVKLTLCNNSMNTFRHYNYVHTYNPYIVCSDTE